MLSWRTLPARRLLKRPQRPLSCVDYPEEMKEAYLDRMAWMSGARQKLCVRPGVMETLETLKGRYALGIVSNHHAWLNDALKELGLRDFFQSVVISEVVGMEKPDARIMALAMRELNAAPEECLYVGDHPLDVVCAKKAGMDCAWIVSRWGAEKAPAPYAADYHIGRVAELIDILRKD